MVILMAIMVCCIAGKGYAFTNKTHEEIMSEAIQRMPDDLRVFLEDYKDILLQAVDVAKGSQLWTLKPTDLVKDMESLIKDLRNNKSAETVAFGFGFLGATVAEVNMPLFGARTVRDVAIKEKYELYIEGHYFYIEGVEAQYIPTPYDYFEQLLRKTREDDNLVRIVYFWNKGEFSEEFRNVTKRYVIGAVKSVADVWYTVYKDAGLDFSATFGRRKKKMEVVQEEEEKVVPPIEEVPLSEKFTQPITVDFVNTPLPDVIDTIGKRWGVQIIAQVELPEERVTIGLTDQPLIEALNTILGNYGLYGRAEKENIIIIGPAEALDTVYLRSGEAVRGLVTDYSNKRFTVEVPVGEMRISQDYVDRIEMNRAITWVGAPVAEAPALPEAAPEVARPEYAPREMTEEEYKKWLEAHPRWKSSDEGVVLWEDADNYIGQEVVVQGRIVDTRYDKERGIVLLAFGPDFTKDFKVVIFSPDLHLFPPNPETYYKGKLVRVKGVVQEVAGAPEMIVHSPEQIEVALW